MDRNGTFWFYRGRVTNQDSPNGNEGVGIDLWKWSVSYPRFLPLPLFLALAVRNPQTGWFARVGGSQAISPPTEPKYGTRGQEVRYTPSLSSPPALPFIAAIAALFF